MKLSATPTVLSKLSHPGASGFSSSSAATAMRTPARTNKLSKIQTTRTFIRILQLPCNVRTTLYSSQCAPCQLRQWAYFPANQMPLEGFCKLLFKLRFILSFKIRQRADAQKSCDGCWQIRQLQASNLVIIEWEVVDLTQPHGASLQLRLPRPGIANACR